MHKKTATSIQTWQTCQMHCSANSKTRLQQHKSDLNTDFHINHINWLYVLIRFIYVHDSYIRTHSSKSRTYTSSLNWMQLPRLIRQVSHRREMRGGREATVETAKCVHFVCRHRVMFQPGGTGAHVLVQWNWRNIRSRWRRSYFGSSSIHVTHRPQLKH